MVSLTKLVSKKYMSSILVDLIGMLLERPDMFISVTIRQFCRSLLIVSDAIVEYIAEAHGALFQRHVK